MNVNKRGTGRILGDVVGVTREGALVVKSVPGDNGPRRPPRLGSRVVDARNAPVGRVADVLGPVDSPYLVVEPKGPAKLHRLVGRELYAK